MSKDIEQQDLESVVEIAEKDGLTGLIARDIFDSRLEKTIAEAKRYSRELSLIMADIDDFKQVNDQYGHQTGDQVLEKIGELFAGNLRSTDLAARYGGEELAVILPHSDSHAARHVAENLRKAVAYEFKKGLGVTISLGVASFLNNMMKPEDLIHAADTSLYIAKMEGKNRVEVYGEKRLAEQWGESPAPCEWPHSPVGFHRFIMESLPMALVAMDNELRIICFNHKAEKLTGYLSREVQGKSCREVLNSRLCDNDCPLQQVLLGKTPLQRVETSITNRYGECIPVRISASAIHDGQKHFLGCLEAIEDISREKDIEREKENFQFMVVHDMKSPLIAVTGLTKRLQEKHETMDREKMEKHLASIRHAGSQLDSQVKEFLEYCRQASGKIELNPQEVNPLEIIDQLVTRHEDRAAKQKISIMVEHRDEVKIKADPTHLQRVIENLLDNAIKFCPRHGKIFISTHETEQEFIIQMQDTGMGIAEEELPYIFDAFHRGKDSEQGHGLGLAAVKAIIREHNGRISAESTPGEGTLFTIRLPKFMAP